MRNNCCMPPSPILELSRELGEKRCAVVSIRLHPETRCFGFVLESDASPRLWLFSGRLQLITAAHVCITAPFPTEGKQMRSNVNSRLLMQHCAKMCAPAARIECAASPSIPHGGRLLARERVSVQTNRQQKKTKKKNPQSSTPTPVSTLVMPSFPNIEVCHLRFISFSAG